MLGPFGFLTDHPYWWLLMAVVVAYLTWREQRRLAEQMRNKVTQRPIRDWQRAGSKAEITRLVNSWGVAGRRMARKTLAWDFGFLAAYGFALTLLCSVGARYLRTSGSSAAATAWAWGAWVALGAPVFDVVENGLLWRMLKPFDGERLPRTMTSVSTIKWIVGLSVGGLMALPALLLDLAGCRFGCG
jgi:hypothetical protein